MAKSKTLIEKQMQRKHNQELVKTIIATKKNAKWFKVAELISSPRQRKISINLEKINKETKEGDIIVIPGKVLSQGEINKKIKVIALNFSEKAKEKLLKAKCEVSTILKETKKNPKAKGIKIIQK